MKHLFLLFFPVLLLGCTSARVPETLTVIDLESSFENAENLLLSDVCEQIEYIPLETARNCVIGEALRVYTTKDYIIAVAFRQNYLFDRHTGKFIREIGRYGEGPDEYMHTPQFSFDEESQSIYAAGSRDDMIEYHLNGTIIRHISHPQAIADNKTIPMDREWFVSDVSNFEGKEPDRLVIYNQNGVVKKKIPNKHRFEGSGKTVYTGLKGVFYKRKNEVYYYANCLDTIYKLSLDSLQPHYRLHLGKYNLPYSQIGEILDNLKRLSQYFEIRSLEESNRYLFFSYGHKDIPNRVGILNIYHFVGYFDKTTNRTFTSAIDKTHRCGFINDMDHFVSIYPSWSWSVSDSEELIMYMEAGDIAEWFEENPDKATNLPEHLKKLSKLTAEDNPVVVIAKLKQ